MASGGTHSVLPATMLRALLQLELAWEDCSWTREGEPDGSREVGRIGRRKGGAE